MIVEVRGRYAIVLVCGNGRQFPDECLFLGVDRTGRLYGMCVCVYGVNMVAGH